MSTSTKLATSYKRYLTDENTPIPRTTTWRKRRKYVRNVASANDEGDMTQMHVQNVLRQQNSDVRQQNSDFVSSEVLSDITDTEIRTAHQLCDEPDSCDKQSIHMNDTSIHTVHQLYDDPDLCDEQSIHTNDAGMHQTDAVTVHELYDESDSCVEQTNNAPGDRNHTDMSVSVSNYTDPCTTLYAAQQTDKSMSPTDLMLLLLKLKHNLTKEATEDVAKLLNVLSDNSVVASSIHNLEKNFVTGQGNVEIHHVCKQCGSYVGVISGSEVCCPLNSCLWKMNVQQSLKNGNFFFYLPLCPQLLDLFDNHEISDFICRARVPTDITNFTDIVDGKLYKQLKLSQSSNSVNLSLTFNCDGVPVFKSSSYCIWPILCVVNELPPSIRRNHVVMASLWFGSGKPDMNVYLEPFVADCTQLAKNGFSWLCPETNVPVNCTVTVAVGVCDAVARPLMQNFKQYNGHYGCGFCLDVGQSVEKGHGHTTVYTYSKDRELRSVDNTRALVLETIESGKPCMGVKGPSLLSLLPHFDVVRGMVPDYMHCICLGVVRQMVSVWFDPKNHKEPFYIGTSTQTVDNKLLTIKPPCSLSRTPRSLSLFKYWKAHEWLAWLLYYSLPVLKDVLPAPYYAHWAVLVDCVAVLLGVDISLAQLVCCEQGFEIFVSEFEKLYGKQHMSFNVHQTLHLVQSVKDWGPLWCHSAFIFESYNAVLLNMVKGTQAVPRQILHTFYLHRAIPRNLCAVLPRCSEPQQVLLKSLASHRRRIRFTVKPATGVTLIGQATYRSLNRSHFVALHSVSPVVNKTVVAYYSRAVVHGEIIHSLHYCKHLKRNSYTVRLVDGRYYQVTTFVVADLGSGEQCYALGRYLHQVPFNFCGSTAILSLKLEHVVAVSKTPSALIAVVATEIVKKCVFISLDSYNVNFICDQLHFHESCT